MLLKKRAISPVQPIDRQMDPREKPRAIGLMPDLGQNQSQAHERKHGDHGAGKPELD
jgi:hypothetical protein